MTEGVERGGVGVEGAAEEYIAVGARRRADRAGRERERAKRERRGKGLMTRGREGWKDDSMTEVQTEVKLADGGAGRRVMSNGGKSFTPLDSTSSTCSCHLSVSLFPSCRRLTSPFISPSTTTSSHFPPPPPSPLFAFIHPLLYFLFIFLHTLSLLFSSLSFTSFLSFVSFFFISCLSLLSSNLSFSS